MGQKVHPVGFRLGVIYDWQSRWFADRGYTELLHEDLRIRSAIMEGMPDAGISKLEIDRNANQVTVTVHTAKPGIVIGRGGQKVDELRSQLEALSGKRVRVNIEENRQPELDAFLVARSVAEQLQRRVAFRRAIKQAVSRTMSRGAQGVKIMIGGRLGGTEMSRRETEKDGRIPLHTLRADIDYGQTEARTTFGRIGVKVWIYKGEILPEPKRRPAEAEIVEAPSAPSAEGEPSAAAVEPVAQAAAPAEPAAEPAQPEPSAAEPVAQTSESAPAEPGTEAVAETAEAAQAQPSAAEPIAQTPEPAQPEPSTAAEPAAKAAPKKRTRRKATPAPEEPEA